MPEPSPPDERRLAAVWFADLVGYSRLAAEDEAAALRLLRIFHASAREEIGRSRGHLVKFIGDAAFAEFSSVEAAVRTALALQRRFTARSAASGRPSLLRIGVHIGDVVITAEGDLYGDGVNIAARLQVEAEPGHVLVSEDVWRQLRQRTEYHFQGLGERELKGITARVAVFDVAVDPTDEGLDAATPSDAEGTAPAAVPPVGAYQTSAGSPGGAAAGAIPIPSPPPLPVGHPRLRKQLLVGFALLLVTLVTGIVLWRGGDLPGMGRPASAVAPPTDMTIIAVLPFSYQGTPAFAHVAAGLLPVLSMGLAEAGRLRSVDHNLVLSRVPTNGAGTQLPLDDAAALASDVGANAFILGTVFESGGRFQITASLYRLEGAPRLLDRWTADGADEWAVIDELWRQILESEFVDPADRLRQLAVRTSSSSSALKHYLVGEGHFRAARYPEAADALRQAVRADPTFAIAHYRLSTAAAWSFAFSEARVAADQARRFSAPLSERDQGLISGWHAFLNGQADEAERQYQRILTEDPQNVEAWSGLGEVRVHFNPLRGRDIREAIEPFEKVLQLAPQYGEARFHLMEFAARAGDVATVDSLLDGVDPESPQRLSWQAARTLAWGADADRTAMMDRLRGTDDLVVGIAAVRLAAHFRDLDAAQSLTRLLTRAERPDSWRAAGHIMSAQGHFARGEWAAGNAELDLSMPLERAWSLEIRALGALLPMAPVDAGGLAALRGALLEWAPGTAVPEGTFFFGTHVDVHPHLRRYLLALIGLRLGDDESAAQHEEALRRSGGSSMVGEFARSLSLSVAAHRAWRNRDGDRALGLLDQAAMGAPVERVALSPFFARALDRHLRAEIVEAMDRPEEALRWYRSLTDAPDILFWAASHQSQAELLAATDAPEDGRGHQARFNALWTGDPGPAERAP